MADEPTPTGTPAQQDTPTPETGTPAQQQQVAPPDAGTRTDAPETNWEERYKHLQADYTRATQQLAEHTRAQEEEQQQQQQLIDALYNPDTQDQAVQLLVDQYGPEQTQQYLDQLGIQLPDPNQEPGQEPQTDPRVEYLIEAEQNRQADQLEADLRRQVEEVAKSKDFELPEALREHAVDRVLMYEETPEQAFEALTAPFAAQQAAAETQKQEAVEEYRQSKRAPAPPVQGQSGTGNVPRGDKASRLALANQIAEQAQQSQR